MSTYVFIYRPPTDSTPSPDAMAAWNAWFEDLGDKVVDRGHPVFARSTLGTVNADTVLGGYSVVNADDLEAAVALAKGCPILERDGGVEVGELTIMD